LFPISDPDLSRRSTPYVNIGIIAISGLIFFWELVLGPTDRQLLFYKWGLIADELAHGHSFEVLEGPLGASFDIKSPIPTWGTVFTSMFLHADVLHFVFNMIFLWVFGDNVEDRLGHVKYLLFYLGAGVAAAWAQVAINMDAQVPMIGSSGAIAGVLGGYLLMYPYSQVRTAIFFFFITFVRIPAAWLLGFWILLQFWGGIGDLGPSAQSGGTAYWAHIGGFAAGLLGIAGFKLLVWRDRLWPRRPSPYGFWPPDDRH